MDSNPAHDRLMEQARWDGPPVLDEAPSRPTDGRPVRRAQVRESLARLLNDAGQRADMTPDSWAGLLKIRMEAALAEYGPLPGQVEILRMFDPVGIVVRARSEHLDESLVERVAGRLVNELNEVAGKLKETPTSGMPSQSYAVPYGTVRRVTELLDTRPGGWVGAVETLLEFTDTVKQERDLARRQRDEQEKRAEFLARSLASADELLVRVVTATTLDVDYEGAVEDVETTYERLSQRRVEGLIESDDFQLIPDEPESLTEVQQLRASMVRDLIVHAEMPPASVPAEVDRLVRYVLEGRP